MADASGEPRFVEDIRAEPERLRAILGRLLGPQRRTLEEAAALLRSSQPWIAGMGSSFHGGLAVLAFFDATGRAARNGEAGELLHFAELPQGTVLLLLSRSGRSVEVVELARKAQRTGIPVVGVTNDPSSPLAAASRVALRLDAPFDFNVTVTMYSGVALAGALAAAMAVGAWSEAVGGALERALSAAATSLPRWSERIAASSWIEDGAPATILLARGPGLAAALETRQLFEEAAKLPATALSTGGFRHGPNEVVRPGCRVLLWLPAAEPLRTHDLELAADLRRAGARVALIGAALPEASCDLALELPADGVPPAWHFLLETMPARLVVAAVARARGVDCDRFDYCPFVVESEGGLGRGDRR